MYRRTYNYSVLPGEDGELIESGDKIPACGDVASDEDADGEDGERVHRALLPATAHDLLRQRATTINTVLAVEGSWPNREVGGVEMREDDGVVPTRVLAALRRCRAYEGS